MRPCALLSAVLVALTAAPVIAQQNAAPTERPLVEVVFCLDTTGSMGGLIDAAKKKIWSISNQIASGNPTPQVRVGLVAYRDRGDAYVTKVFDLTDDLDAIYGHLMGLQAQGGGDTPESVNQALHEAVTKIKWSDRKKTLKLIFLVGDAPPQVGYKDDVKYTETCRLAVKNNIIINTVQCGRDTQTTKYWQEICRLAEGSYVQIDQQGGPVIAVATPYDKDLADINSELTRSTLVFGAAPAQREARMKLESVTGPAGGFAAPAAADRAAFNARVNRGGNAYDLLTNIKNGKVQLEKLKKEELPAELRDLPLDGQKAYLDKLDKRRQELSEKAIELDRKRSAFVAKKLVEDEKSRPRESFDGQVLDLLQRQARRIELRYEDKK